MNTFRRRKFEFEIDIWNTKREEREKTKKHARKRKEKTQENTQIFTDFQREGMLSGDQKICGVPTAQTNPTNYNK